MRGDDFEAGAQPEVKGIAEADLGADFLEVARRHRLDRPVGADRHEDRRFDDAVRQRQATAPSGAVVGKKFELHFYPDDNF